MKYRRFIGWALCAAGIALMAGAVVWYAHDRTAMPQPPAGAIGSFAAPSSVKPAPQAVDNYSVAPTLPKYISIPAIGVAKSRVVQLGLLKSGAIAAPSNIFDAGWYNGSARPGQSGAAFIYGHVSSWTANGVFYDLKKLRPDDAITITRGDNAVFTYRVAATKIYPYNSVDMNQVLAPVYAGTPGLNLMTCTGDIIKGTSEFNERLVVFATQTP